MGSRYYDSSEHEIGPGKISKQLREALNIPENDLPIWIYRMRALGYPPGWLKKAIVETSDIFDTDTPQPNSRKRKNPPEDVQYDHSKLIEYPGFNTPLPENCIDYHFYVNMPAMLEHQQLDYAKKHMNAFKPAATPKRLRIMDASSSSVNDTSKDLETDESSASDDTTVSPDQSSIKIKSESQDKSSDCFDIKDAPIVKEEIKFKLKGTPTPKLVTRAPLEKFSEGVVGELLYFENIPESTGKYDSIRGLLKTIRSGEKVTKSSTEAASSATTDTSFGSTRSADSTSS